MMYFRWPPLEGAGVIDIAWDFKCKYWEETGRDRHGSLPYLTKRGAVNIYKA